MGSPGGCVQQWLEQVAAGVGLLLQHVNSGRLAKLLVGPLFPVSISIIVCCLDETSSASAILLHQQYVLRVQSDDCWMSMTKDHNLMA